MSATPDTELPDLYEVRITGTPEAIRDILARFDLDVGCRRPHIDPSGAGDVTLHAFASEARIAEMESAGVSIERGANVSAQGRERQSEVGKGDRFDGGRFAPEGLGTLVREDEEKGEDDTGGRRS